MASAVASPRTSSKPKHVNDFHNITTTIVQTALPDARQAQPGPASPNGKNVTASKDADSDQEIATSAERNISETIDMETFQQILDLDEDDTYEFSRGMAWAYFSQASSTFVEMHEALKRKDLKRLSELGHFLKGSSATLGVSKVQDSCEKIQHYGQLRDEELCVDLTASEALGKIQRLLGEVEKEYATAESWLRQWYRDNCGEESTTP